MSATHVRPGKTAKRKRQQAAKDRAVSTKKN